METRNLGQSGLLVSSIGLANNFGARINEEQRRPWSSTRRSTSASPCSTPPTSTATAAAPRKAMGRILGDDRKRIVLATKFASPMGDH